MSESPQSNLSESTEAVERIARAFHTAYEELAPEFGYRTREASAVPWESVPEANKNLMRATIEQLLADEAFYTAEQVQEIVDQFDAMAAEERRLHEQK